MTICIQIGNTDNKLTQQEWAEYVAAIQDVLDRVDAEVHFSGGPATHMAWQNFCWVVDIEEEVEYALRGVLTEVRQKYGQESIALMMGYTIFI